MNALEEKLEFVKDEKYGYLTFCPSNIGTSLRASVHVKLLNIEKSGQLNDVAKNLGLQVRGVSGEFTESVGGVYDVSNLVRLGRTEWDLINSMW